MLTNEQWRKWKPFYSARDFTDSSLNLQRHKTPLTKYRKRHGTFLPVSHPFLFAFLGRSQVIPRSGKRDSCPVCPRSYPGLSSWWGMGAGESKPYFSGQGHGLGFGADLNSCCFTLCCKLSQWSWRSWFDGANRTTSFAISRDEIHHYSFTILSLFWSWFSIFCFVLTQLRRRNCSRFSI